MLNSVKKLNYEKILKILIVVIAFVIYFTWSCSQPYNSAPDEEMKYDICKYIVKHNALPHGGDSEVRNPIWGISYGFTPILSYIISALFIKIVMIFTQNEFAFVVAARFASVLFNTLTVFITIKISEKLFKGIYKWLFVIMIAFLPQFAFLGSYINNDSLALFSISIIIYSWLLGINEKWNNKACILLGVGIGICALSYYNAYGYILISIFLFIISNFLINQKLEIKDILKKGFIIAGISFIIAGWWFIRNAVIYEGDFLGLRTESEYGEKYAMEDYKPSLKKTPQNTGKTLWIMLKDMRWLKSTYFSFIGIFGYMYILIPYIIYAGYFILYLFAFIRFFDRV